MKNLYYSMLLPSALVSGSAGQTAQSVQAAMHSRRELMQVDFDSICGDLLSIFNGKCNCGDANQVQSGDSIDCDNGKLTAHAEFESYKITSMKICDDEEVGGKVCSTIYYAQTIAVHCELAYNDHQCDSCFVCDADGLLGLRVNCDSTFPAVTTDGCEVASTYLHLNSGARNEKGLLFALAVSTLLTSIWMLR